MHANTNFYLHGMSPYRDWVCEYTDANQYIPYLVHMQEFTNQRHALIKDICNLNGCERYNIVRTLECEYYTLKEEFPKNYNKICLSCLPGRY